MTSIDHREGGQEERAKRKIAIDHAHSVKDTQSSVFENEVIARQRLVIVLWNIATTMRPT